MDEAGNRKIMELWEQRNALNLEITKLLSEDSQMVVEDYPLMDFEGNTLKLSDCFGDHVQLVLVHNMGKHCNYCTLWAEGLKGVWRHIESGEYGNKAAFVLLNNDTPEEQKAFAAEHGWDFPMYSCKGTTLFSDLGFQTEKDGEVYYHPGVSTLLKGDSGTLRRHAKDSFGPGDQYCSVFHFFNLFPKQEALAG